MDIKQEKSLTALSTGFSKSKRKGKTSGDPMPGGHDIATLKDRFLKNLSKIQFWLHKLSASGVISTKQRKSVVSLIQGMPTGPYLCLKQILSKYFKPFRSYEVHKNLA